MNKRKNEVIEIPAKPVETDQPVKRQLRVAAYCRVSTNQESQQNSYQAQKAYYTDKIASNPDWCLAGIFADEGISGTSAEKRPAFQRMIRCCKKGKIDLILTKSISRLSRNTVDCLQYVRLLQELRIPVIFEAEGINTLNMQNEFLLAVMGANSQAESEATSSRVKWGVRNAFREGKVRYYYQYWLGYRKGKDGTPEIIPEEAETVKQIYADYLSGKSLRSIADSLESRGILPRAGQAKWTTTYIRGILQNERYTGDALLQKTYTTDPITKKQKKNRGELPQYLVKNCHPAIISHELFDLVQKEISRRSVATGNSDADSARPKPAYSGKYALSELLVCGECNTLYRRCTWKGNKGTRIVWRCRSRLDHGKKYCKHSPTLDEAAIHQALVNAINQQLVRPEYLLAPFEKIPFHLSAFPVPAKSWPELYSNLLKRQSMLDTEIVDLIAEYAANEDWKGESELLIKILRERNKCANYISTFRLDRYGRDFSQDRFHFPYCLTEYNDAVVRYVVDTIKVLDKQYLQITFKGGLVVEQKIPSN